MSVTDIYGSANSGFLKAADLPHGVPTTVYIAEAIVKDTNFNNTPGKQLVLTLYGQEKKFGLNATQARAIEALYGGDWNQWVNQGIQIYPKETTYKGQPVKTIEVVQLRVPMDANMVQQGQAWLAQFKAKEAQAAAQAQQTPQFSGPPQAPQNNAFNAPPPAPVQQTGAQFDPGAAFSPGGNPFQS